MVERMRRGPRRVGEDENMRWRGGKRGGKRGGNGETLPERRAGRAQEKTRRSTSSARGGRQKGEERV